MVMSLLRQALAIRDADGDTLSTKRCSTRSRCRSTRRAAACSIALGCYAHVRHLHHLAIQRADGRPLIVDVADVRFFGWPSLRARGEG